MKKAVVLVLILSLFFGYACAARAEAAPRKLTLMIYLCGSNLESKYGSASTDMEEIANAGVDFSQVTVLVMRGGSAKWGDQTVIGRVWKAPFGKKAGFVPENADSAPRNMGEAETLAYFLRYGVEKYPAQEYALILWDHGGGPVNGVCWDEQYGGDHLTLDELTGALDASPFSEKKLSWIGFDACLMSSVEVASKMAPYAGYMIASQAEEPGSGWNYAFLKGIENDRDGGETGKRIIDSYFSVSYKTSPDLTMACVDLSRIAEVEASMDAMYQRMASQLNVQSFSAIAKLRQTATGFGKSLESITSSGGYDLVDVASLSDCYAAENPEGAENVREAVKASVVYSRSSVENCNGLSVYHPFRNQNGFLSEWGEAYKSLDFCPGYTSYVNSYGRIMAGEHMTRWNDLTNIQAIDLSTDQDKENYLITLNISEEQAANLASARLVVLAQNPYDHEDDAFFRLYSTAEVEINGTTLSAAYGGTVMSLVDDVGADKVSRAVSYRVTENGVYQLALYPYGEDFVRPEKPIIAEYVMDASGRLLLKDYLVYDEMTDAYSARGEADLSQYKGITFRNEYRVPTTNAMGEYVAFDNWELDQHTSMRWKARRDVINLYFQPTLSVDMISTELKWAVFEITDTQGNVCTSEAIPLGGTKIWPLSNNILSDDIPDMYSAHLFCYPEYHDYYIWLNIENCSSEEQSYFVSDFAINGLPLENANYYFIDEQHETNRLSSSKRLPPGEEGSIVLVFDESDLEAVSPDLRIEHVSGELEVISGENDDLIAWYGFSFDPSASDTEIYDDDGEVCYATEDIAVKYPLWKDDYLQMGYLAAAIVQEGALPQNSEIIFDMGMENTSDHDIRCILSDVRLNGASIDKKYYGVDRSGNGIIAPGEDVYLNIEFKYADLSVILPDPALLTVEYSLKVVNTDNHIEAKIPLIFQGEIPLDCFYRETSVLPRQPFIDLCRELGVLDAETAKPLFAYGDCAVYLQGFYILGYKPVVLLRIENASESEWKIALGQAKMNGQEAVIGRTVAPFVSIRNERNQVYGIPKEPWPETPGVCLQLKPGETQYCYAELSPVGENLTELSGVSFRAYMEERNGRHARVYFDDIEITWDESTQMYEDREIIQQYAFYDYELHVKQGQPLPPENDPQVLVQSVPVPEASEIREILLETLLPEDEQIASCYYFLRRVVRSDAELAEMNIICYTYDNEQARSLFASGKEWMIYEAVGSMSVGEDGRAASAVYLGVRPMITNGQESIPMIVRGISANGDGSFTIESPNDSFLLLNSNRFQAVLTGYLGAIKLSWKPQDRQAEVASYQLYSKNYTYYPSLTDLVAQDIILHPADLPLERLSEILTENDTLWQEYRQSQYLILNEPKIQLMLEPLTDPENYEVLFFYYTTDGRRICFDAPPLTDFIQNENQP